MSNKYDIDKMIEQINNGAENISVGGSSCFDFGDVIVVKYTIPAVYNYPRIGSEELLEHVNKLNEQGVNTPKHIAVKRTVEGKLNCCYVVQEKCTGDVFTKYCQNQSSQFAYANKIKNLPQCVFEKFVKDTIVLFGMGIEYKSKNLFLDYNKNNPEQSKFQIIDLWKERPECKYTGSIIDDCILFQSLNSIAYAVTYMPKADDKTKEIYSKISLDISNKIFKAVSNVSPTFEKNKRWILRKLKNDSDAVYDDENFNNLTLNKDEEKLFDSKINECVNELIEKITKGDLAEKYNQNKPVAPAINMYISNTLGNNLMSDSYKYSSQCTIKAEDYENEFDYNLNCRLQFRQDVFQRFVDEFNRVVNNKPTEKEIEKS